MRFPLGTECARGYTAGHDYLETRVKLNLGCGSQTPEGWLNVDYSAGARVMKIPFFRALNRKMGIFALDWNRQVFLHDLRRRFPWPDSTADVIYISHTLEHFSREDGRRLLSECHRVLRMNGIIRILVPDLRCAVDDYIGGLVRADEFVEKLGVLYGTGKRGLKFGLSPFVEFPHKCMYDASSLLGILDAAGFQSREKAAFDSDIDDIRTIELEDRTRRAVVVEGRKR